MVVVVFVKYLERCLWTLVLVLRGEVLSEEQE